MNFLFVKLNFKWLEWHKAKQVEQKDLTCSIVLLLDVCYLRLTKATEKDVKHSQLNDFKKATFSTSYSCKINSQRMYEWIYLSTYLSIYPYNQVDIQTGILQAMDFPRAKVLMKSFPAVRFVLA